MPQLEILLPVVKVREKGIEKLIKFTDNMSVDDIRRELQRKFTDPDISSDINKLRAECEIIWE